MDKNQHNRFGDVYVAPDAADHFDKKLEIHTV